MYQASDTTVKKSLTNKLCDCEVSCIPVNEHLSSCPRVAVVREYRSRIEQRVKLLTANLMHELQLSPERSIRGGPRSARRAVTQLIRLGKSAQVRLCL